MLPDGTPREGSDDVLNLLTLEHNWRLTVYSAYLWDITTLIPGIPVLAIMVRYNLLSGGVCNKFWSFFWGEQPVSLARLDCRGDQSKFLLPLVAVSHTNLSFHQAL